MLIAIFIEIFIELLIINTNPSFLEDMRSCSLCQPSIYNYIMCCFSTLELCKKKLLNPDIKHCYCFTTRWKVLKTIYQDNINLFQCLHWTRGCWWNWRMVRQLRGLMTMTLIWWLYVISDRISWLTLLFHQRYCGKMLADQPWYTNYCHSTEKASNACNNDGGGIQHWGVYSKTNTLSAKQWCICTSHSQSY
jgi:hypothetical protein